MSYLEQLVDNKALLGFKLNVLPHIRQFGFIKVLQQENGIK
ncbi:hypothetical protein PPEP_a1420 [Pseudoalteromonas peptidolytica F12-50-A1]|uniref:Uncharacterized protein n=1 Tax=Pseudoalteromonas peptidolytica F12-50-A1 TaxID=1315280 RepID=A0A8I0MW67_9GAMM|nr:hypothetical protein [Pseudoalteromonas peptidolytica F12-50-A1]